MKSEASKKILEQKKCVFLSWIDYAVQNYKINNPISVKFWENYDKNHFENARAHIHLETSTICIPEEELGRMNEEEIKETAIHEITHVLEKDHNSQFYEALNNELVSSWAPASAGIIKISENNYKIGLLGDTIKKKHCNYHLCHKIDKRLPAMNP